MILVSASLNATELANLSQIEADYKSQNYAKASADLTIFLTLDPKNVKAQKLLMESNYRLGKFREAYRLHSDEEVEYITNADILKLRALAHYKEDNFFSAINSVKRLRSLQSLNSDWNRFYYYLIFKINAKSALEDLKKLSKYNPSIETSILFCDLLILGQQNEKAVTVIDAALKKDYLNVTLIEKSGDAHFAAKNYDNAIATYMNLINLFPDRNDLKLKLARSFFKSNSIVQAQNILSSLTDEESTNYKIIVDKISNDLLKNPNPRILANVNDEVSDKSHIDLRQKIEKAMVPNEFEKDANVPMATEVIIESKPIVKEFDFKDQHLLEFTISPKAKSYSLRGNGFNAEVDYSNGLSIAGNYTFHPENRNWNLNLGFSQSRSKFDKLSGLTPDSIELNEININLFGIYFYNNFYLGPQFIYESINTTQTRPNTIRGNIDFFNIGAVFGYQSTLNEKLSLSLQLGFNENIVTTSKTILVGSVEERRQYLSSLEFIQKYNDKMKFKFSVQYSQTDTSYAGSENRGTVKAREKETEWMLPLGIIYEI